MIQINNPAFDYDQAGHGYAGLSDIMPSAWLVSRLFRNELTTLK